MPIALAIDVFSGRPNPTVVVRGPEEVELLERLRPERPATNKETAPFSESLLGYRGVSVEIKGRRPRGLPASFRVVNGFGLGGERPFRIADSAFEEFVCGSTGPFRPVFPPEPDLPELLRKELDRFIEWWDRWRPPPKIKWPVRPVCPCGPLYEPGWWNVPARQPDNNCYNYGTNVRTNTFAQPGRAAGAHWTHPITCASVRPGAIADELIDDPGADNKCPKEGHLVALVVWPSGDYHWYRKGRNGRWSHKPGGTPVTNLDNSGAVITDPRTADRGNYTDFCTFMVVMHGHVRIN
jgi:hypothetical protein